LGQYQQKILGVADNRIMVEDFNPVQKVSGR
jgi:hypothetical protein